MTLANSLIHPTAIVHPDAKIGEGTRIGAFSIIDEDVVIGANCEIKEHAIIRSHTRIGDEAKVFSFAVVGEVPQHLRYAGEPTQTIIGDRVTLRESCTVHRGTVAGGGVTRVGNDTYIMAYSHIAHDCSVGEGVIMANTVQLAGHCTVDDFVTIGGQSAAAQFCRIGRYCYLGGGTIVRKDVPPFLVGKGSPFECQGINAIGLARRGFSEVTIKRLRTVYKIFFMQNLTVANAIEKILFEVGDSDEVRLFLDFIKSSKLGFER